jgi:hypothetical protein
MPGRYVSIGQKREESGVSASSISVSTAVVVQPELELGVGDDDAALRRMVRRHRIRTARARPSRTCVREVAPSSLHHGARSRCSRRVGAAGAFDDGVNSGSGSLSACFRPAGQANAADFPRALVVLPAGADEVAAHDGLDGQRPEALHAPPSGRARLGSARSSASFTTDVRVDAGQLTWLGTMWARRVRTRSSETAVQHAGPCPGSGRAG